MNFKSIAIALLALSAASAQASVWTVTATGTISKGYDYTGVFGVVGRDLSGLSYTQSITASTDGALWTYHFVPGVDNPINNISGSGPGFVDTVTVDGYTVTFNEAKTLSGQQLVSNGATTRDADYSYDQVYSAQDSGRLYAYSYAYSTQAIGMTASFDQSVTLYPVIVADTYSYFNLDRAQSAYFAGIADKVTATGEVPEPASLALFGLGLAGAAAIRRRKQK